MILGITPARGASKGIPGKNIKEIAGKPLIAWTIEAAKKSKLLDRYIVSTEDEEIARIAKNYNAEVLDRPAELAGDKVSTLSVLQHAVQAIPCSTVVLLQATSPIRGENLIDDCIREFQDRKYDSLATGFFCKYTEYGKDSLRRQEIEGFFYDDGNVYVINAGLIRKGERFGKNIGKKLTSRRENVDIDDEFDFWMAGQILLQGKL